MFEMVAVTDTASPAFGKGGTNASAPLETARSGNDSTATVTKARLSSSSNSSMASPSSTTTYTSRSPLTAMSVHVACAIA